MRKTINLQTIKEIKELNDNIKNNTNIDLNKKSDNILRFGDVIFFKHSNEIDIKKNNNYHSSFFNGILLGDGLSNNKVFCSDINQIEKFSVSKCLFRIEKGLNQNVKKIFKSKDINYNSKLNEELSNYNEEKKNSIGKPLVYGETIILKHIYSECYLTLEPELWAKQIGCLQIILNEEFDENSNFMIVPSNKLKRIGDKINYLDYIKIQTDSDDLFYVHCNESINKRNEKDLILEVNASETFSKWKPKLFSNYIFENKDNNSNIMKSTECFKLYNKKLGGYLSVSNRNINKIMKKVQYMTTSDSIEKDSLKLDNKLYYNMIDPKKTIKQDLILEISENPSFFSLWEIQRKEFFDNENIKYNLFIKIKNVATGLFLYYDDEDNEIILINEIEDNNGYFYFKSISNNSKKNLIEKLDILKILTFNNSLLNLKKNKDKDYRINVINKKYSEKSLFQIQKCDTQIVKNVNIICSLFPSLLKFYIFYQNWGNISNNESNNFNYLQFNYEKTIEQRWELEEEIDDLFQSFESLFDYLNENNNNDLNLLNISNFKYSYKQNLLLNQNILEILILIWKLIVNKTFESLLSETEKDDIEKFSKLKEKIFDIKIKNRNYQLPQIISKKLLNRTIINILNILNLSCINNKYISSYLSNYFIFFTKLFDFYQYEISLLLKEITNNISEFKNKKIFIDWIENIKYPNESNIKKQLFFLSITKNFLFENKKPVIAYQEIFLENFIFKREKFNNISFDLNKEDDNIHISFKFKDKKSLVDFRNKNKIIISESKEFIENLYYININIKDIGNNLENTNHILYSEYFIDYIKHYIELLNFMCKGRFQKGIDKCIKLGLNNIFCEIALKDKNLNINITNSIIKYYNTCFYDLKSVERISYFNNYTFKFDYIKNINIKDQPLNWINNKFINNLEEENKQKNDNEITTIRFIKEILTDLKEINSLNVKNNIHKIKYIKEELLLNILSKLNLIYDSFDFGYISFKNIRYFFKLINTIINYFKPFDEVIEYFELFNDSEKYIYLLKIFNKVIELLKIILNFKIKIQTIWILKLFTVIRKDEYSQKLSIFKQILNILSISPKKYNNINKIKEDSTYIDNKYSNKVLEKENLIDEINNLEEYFYLKPKNLKKKKLNKSLNNSKNKNYERIKENIENKFKTENNSFIENLYKKKNKKPTNKKSQNFNNNLENDLFEFLNFVNYNKNENLTNFQRTQDLSLILSNRKKIKYLSLLENNIIEIIENFYDQNLLILNNLLKIELIYNFNNLNNFTTNINDYSILFKDNCNRLLYYQNNNIKYNDDIKLRLAIKDFIKNRLIENLYNTYINKKNLLKVQNMIKNLEIHKIIFQLLKINNINKNLEIIQYCINFFYYLTIYNNNQLFDIEKINTLFELITYNIKVSKLFRNIFYINKNEINRYIINKAIDNITIIIENKSIKILFYKDDIAEDENILKLWKVLIENINILTYSLIEHDLTSNNVTYKKLIIDRLFKNFEILSLMKYKYHRIKKNSFYYFDKELKILIIKIYNKFIKLFANLSRNYNYGILKIKNLITLEEIINIIYQPNYFYTKNFLKLLHYCYFDDIKNYLNSNNFVKIINFIIYNLDVYLNNLTGITSNEKNKIKIENYLKNKNIDFSNSKNIFFKFGKDYYKKLIKEEYWKFIYKKSSINSYGFLTFVYFIYANVNKNLNSLNSDVIDYLTIIKKKFIDMLNELIEVEKISTDFNFSEYIFLISEIIKIGSNKIFIINNVLKIKYKNTFIEKKNTNNIGENKNLYYLTKINNFINKVKFIMIDKGISLDFLLSNLVFERSILTSKKFMNLFDIDNMKDIRKIFNYFLDKNQINDLYLNDNVILSSYLVNMFIEIEDILINIDFDNEIELDNIKINSKLAYLKKSYNLGDEIIDKNEIKDNNLYDFIEEFGNNLLKNNYFIYTNWIKKIYISIENKNIVKKQLNLYGKPEFKKFLIKMFYLMLIDKIDNKKELIKFQNLLNESQITFLCVNIIAYDDNDEVKNYSLFLLNMLLFKGNKNVQDNIFKILNYSVIKISFFNYLKNKINEIKNNIDNDLLKFGSKIKLKYLNINSVINKFTLNDNYYILLNIFNFFKLCCQDCFIKLQNIFRDQYYYLNNNQSNISTNMVNELADFASIIILHLNKNKKVVYKLIRKLMDTIIEFSLGPCSGNQKVLIENTNFLYWLNNCFKLDIFNNNIDNIKLFFKSIKILNSIISENYSTDLLKKILKNIDLQLLKKHIIYIYNNIILKNKTKIKLEKFIKKINLKKQIYEQKGKISYYNTLWIYSSFEIFLIFKILEREVNFKIFNKSYISKNLKELLNFYNKFYAFIEVNKTDISNNSNKLITIDFIIPIKCYFITKSIKYDWIWLTNRNSDQERLIEFWNKVDNYKSEMIQKQYYYKFPLITSLIKKWVLFKDIGYLIVIIINIILIISLRYDNNTNNNNSVTVFNLFDNLKNSGSNLFVIYTVLSYIQLILSLLAFILCYAERYSTALFNYNYNTNTQYNLISKDRFTNKRFGLKEIMEKIRMFFYVYLTKNTFTKIIYTLKDTENLYNLTYIIISILVIVTNPIFYSILLFDLIKRSKDLKNILKSITQNYSQLAKTILLLLFIIYLYAMIGFIYFPFLFNITIRENITFNSCDTLLKCFFTILNDGLRAGGGIGEYLDQVGINNNYYFDRYFYDLSYFIIILIIFLNIIFGIIIDAIADLRNKKLEQSNNILNVCFICGVEKNIIISHGESWEQHIRVKHNVYNYLYFILYVKDKNLKKLIGVEKSIKKNIKNKEIKFFPINNDK